VIEVWNGVVVVVSNDGAVDVLNNVVVEMITVGFV
jgi:hypothetical protein